jgi:hypothetical protein
MLAIAVLLSTLSCGVETPPPKPAPTPAKETRNLPPSVDALLSRAQELEVLSLDPQVLNKPPADAYHGWRVLGRTAVRDAGRTRELLDAISKGIQESDGRVAMCFEPRHGIRARAGDATVDLVICFACYQMEAYVNGARVGNAATTSSPQAALNAVLREAHVPLPTR